MLRNLFFIFTFIFIFISCGDKKKRTNERLTTDLYATLSISGYEISTNKVRKHLNNLVKADKDSFYADYLTRRFYRTHSSFIWISRTGVSFMAEQLVNELETVHQLGFSQKRFFVKNIIDDLKSIRTLSFSDKEPIHVVLARLEFYLTKALMRYCIGQRYGFINPNSLFNRLDKIETDDNHLAFQRLYDIPTEHPDTNFLNLAIKKVQTDSLSYFFVSIKPRNPLYKRLTKELLKTKSLSYKRLLLCNIERTRWRHQTAPENCNKYVLVNIPSFLLVAKDNTKTLSMRIACGTLVTKTPLLYSDIQRMDINPVWIMPLSIVKKSILPHLGNATFFAKHNYFIKNFNTGETISSERVTAEMITSGTYKVVQKGGDGNSLGRIVFRFPNNFSVYLHDTPSKSAFQSFDRGVSHGCVRVERPFELAVFLLENKDTTFISKLHYSMTAPINKQNNDLHIDKKKIIGTKRLSPNIPLFITYFTVYPDNHGKLIRYPDVYGYDKVMWNTLSHYVR